MAAGPGGRFTVAINLRSPGQAMVAMMALLMNISGLEAEARRDIDLDAEMRTAGIAILVAGFAVVRFMAAGEPAAPADEQGASML